MISNTNIMISKTNLGLYLMDLDVRDKLYSMMNECENKYYHYNSDNKLKITFEKMPISPVFRVEKRQVENIENADISCYSFLPLNRISKTEKVAFSLPIDIDFTNYFTPLCISEDNKKALNHVEYNNIFQFLNKKYSKFDYKSIDNDYKMPYIFAISLMNKSSVGIIQRFQEIAKNILN